MPIGGGSATVLYQDNVSAIGAITASDYGTTVHVTPGSPNNLRSSSTGASIGKIPGGASFQVLQGPTCLNNAVWWQVNYNGLISWTAEGQGSTYYLQP